MIFLGDFNAGDINWDKREVNSGQHWDNKLLDLANRYLLYQHVNETTGVRGEDTPSLLDLTFTRMEQDIENIYYTGFTY